MEEGVDLERLVTADKVQAVNPACAHVLFVVLNKAGWWFGGGTAFLDSSSLDEGGWGCQDACCA